MAERIDAGAPDTDEPVDNVTVPLADATSARLVFTSGAAGVTIGSNPVQRDLCRAHFEHHVPTVRTDLRGDECTVTVAYRNFSILNPWVYRRDPLAEIMLRGAMPWVFEMQGGVSKLVADLRDLVCAALQISGGASGMAIMLPAPVGHVAVRIGGGASNVTIHRPAGTAMRVHLHSGASNLTLDTQYLGAIGGGVRWETPAAQAAADRYELEIGGGASNVTVGVL